MTQGKSLACLRLSRRGSVALASLVLLLFCSLGRGALAAQVAPGCLGGALHFEALAPGLWLIPGAPGDANAANRGAVSNLLLAFDGPRTWLLGSGPSPTWARQLSCSVAQRFGRRITDTVSPWPRPELVLGQSGLPNARSWAHADVARAMRLRCAGCVERLRARLGAAAGDLDAAPLRLPKELFQGASGRLGPWQWRRLSRGENFPVSVWVHRASGLHFAPGLLWGGTAPDGRDADLAVMAASTQALPALPANAAVPTRWLGEQGGVLSAEDWQAQQRYWGALDEALQAAMARGDDESAPAPRLPGLEALSASPAHALNWQRAWRQAESRWLQRNLR